MAILIVRAPATPSELAEMSAEFGGFIKLAVDFERGILAGDAGRRVIDLWRSGSPSRADVSEVRQFLDDQLKGWVTGWRRARSRLEQSAVMHLDTLRFVECEAYKARQSTATGYALSRCTHVSEEMEPYRDLRTMIGK
jgi:hypothetical protein